MPGLVEAVDAAAGAGVPVEIALDGESGVVLIDPDEAARAALRDRAQALADRRARAAAARGRPGATADGARVLLVANIGSPDDAARALEVGAEGVGLFRTEFLFMQRQAPPAEDEQVAAYRRAFEAFGPGRPVVVRLADIGGDKGIPYLGLPPEANPFLGVRAIRLAYRDRDLLGTQLRAIWRAGGLAGVVPHVMAPMVATLEDVDLLDALRDEARAAVLAAGHPCAETMVTGIMVEIPAAALLAPELARRVAFFSIGTNDLTQYLMAADRGNAALARFQDALHPAVLRAIAGVVAGADAAGIPVAVCGELAGDPAGALVLVGLGVDELSADAGSLDEVRGRAGRVHDGRAPRPGAGRPRRARRGRRPRGSGGPSRARRRFRGTRGGRGPGRLTALYSRCMEAVTVLQARPHGRRVLHRRHPVGRHRGAPLRRSGSADDRERPDGRRQRHARRSARASRSSRASSTCSRERPRSCWPAGWGRASRWRSSAGIAAIIGHSRSPFLGFSGGRGVSAAFGAALVLAPCGRGRPARRLPRRARDHPLHVARLAR